jgi:Cys-rich repeat protein
VTGQGCTSSSQCPTGRVCVAASCAGLGNFCAVRCTA